jgi:transposase
MKTKQTYTVEFRAEAVKLVLEQGLSQREAASRLGISKGTLANWVVSARAGSEKPAPGARSVAELEAENARLRKELAEARLERDIVKKAAAYFARESLPGTRG